MIAAFCNPTMPPPSILTQDPMPISLTERMIALESDGYDATNTTSGLVARMARISAEKSTVLGG